MSEKNTMKFQPIIGTEAKILGSVPTPGCVWFAKDTKKIFYSDGSSFLSMGGNTGVYYGVKIIPEDTDSEQTDFTFSVMEIDGNETVTDGVYKIPNPDDLILNIPDGSFYRVITVLKSDTTVEIKTTRLTLSGSGGGTGPIGPVTGYLLIEDLDGGATKYYVKDTQEALLRFRVNNPINTENNGIAKIIYTIGNLEPISDLEYKNFGEVQFNILPYIKQMNTSTHTTISVYVEDLFGTRKTFYYYINVVELSIKSDIKNDILTTQEQVYHYSCTPMGGSSLTNKEVVISFYDSSNYLVGEPIKERVVISNDKISLDVNVPNIGVYTMTVEYRGQLPTGAWVSSNILSYQIVYYDENPQLIVNLPTNRVEQYSTLNITYMVAAKTQDINDIPVNLTIDNKSDQLEPTTTEQKISYNKSYIWSIEFDTPGKYELKVETILDLKKIFSNIEVYPYEGEVPVITQNGLTLNLSAVNRSNTELNKDSWINGEYNCSFHNFSWGAINGWQKDEQNQNALHLSSGARLEVNNFYPFDANAMANGQTIELDFKFSGVTDFSQGLIKCLSFTDDSEANIQVGFQVTGQESTLNTSKIKATGGVILESDNEQNQIYNTQIQGLTAKFIEGERIHLTWVIEKNNADYPMIRTYLNGILSGITQYSKSDDFMTQNSSKPAKIIFDSTYGNIDIYNIRVYKNSALSANQVLNNFIATCGNIDIRTQKYLDNSSVLDDANKISIEKIENQKINIGYVLSVPYIKIIGGRSLNKDDDGYTLNTEDSTEHLPTAKKDYRLVTKYEFIDPSGKRADQTVNSVFKDNGYLNGMAMYGQGTSSMEYPVKNLRLKLKMKDAQDKKVKFKVNDCSVDLVCLKADYMESSGSHNTGTGNLVYNLTKALDLKTPGQKHWENKVDYDVVSAIRGFPVLIFYKSEEDAVNNKPYEFIGKYNFNLDKATHEPFGFELDEEDSSFGLDEGYQEVNIVKEKAFNNYPFDLYIKNDNDDYIKAENYIPGKQYYSIKNMIHCFEFLNNASKLTNFLNDEGETFEETFNKMVDSEGKTVPNWFTSYESRYPEFEDYASTDIASFYRLCNWINSTNQLDATNNNLINTYEYNGITYDKDSAAYRLAKFKKEFNDYLNFDFTCFYYILTHVLLMIDSRAKNMMIATWDNTIWYPIFYDMDTMLGLNNYGYNKYHYDVEDTDPNIYNGQASVLWNNFRTAYPDEITAFYQEMQNAGLTYERLLENYNKNQADAMNENVYNNDANYKYIRPFSEGFIDSSGSEIINVAPGQRDYLYASQGNRSMHRKWWLKNRINYFNGKYLSEAYKNDKYTMRLYTPQKGIEFYEPVGQLTETEFMTGDYYILSYDENGDSVYTKANTYSQETVYYRKTSNSEQLNASIDAVPPNNDFILTPLYNQYLSIAFGGSNGITTAPAYAEANKALLISSGNEQYNDTETYLYGGSMIKDLGDLSAQYIGQFHFPNVTTKLENLILGNPHDNYYNPNFSNLTIGSSAPYLKLLDITNCSGLSGRSVDLENCQNLQKVHAMGSGITSVVLPKYGILNELRLPASITSLKLIQQTNLRQENFTIGTCSYDPITKIKNYFPTENGKIITLRIENTPVNVYDLVMKNNNLQWFYLRDVELIIDKPAQIIRTNGQVKIDILERLLELEPASNEIDLQPPPTFGQSITGKIIIKSDANISDEEALSLYTYYTTKPDSDARYFPNLEFEFEDKSIYNVNIYNGTGEIYWTKKIQGGEAIDITEEFLSSGPNGRFEIPSITPTAQYIYTFTNKWKINDSVEIDGSEDEDIYGWPLVNDLLINNNVSLTPIFNLTPQSYTITFILPPYSEGEDGVISGQIIEKTAAYGTPINTLLPQIIPYLDSSNLAFDRVYSFIGYNDEYNATDILEFNDSKVVTGNEIYYAIFEEISVYDNIHEDYFIYSAEKNYIESNNLGGNSNENITGYLVSLNKDKELKGKITIPYEYMGKPVWGIENKGFYGNQNITHVFVGRENKNDAKTTKLKYIGEEAFGGSNLIYFDFPFETLRTIDKKAFQLCKSLQPNYQDNKNFYFGDNLYAIKEMAFNQSLIYNSNTIIYLPSSLVILGSRAFSYLEGSKKDKLVSFVIGDSVNKSDLNFNNNKNDINLNGLIELPALQFNDPIIYQIDFYSNIYSNWQQETEISYKNNNLTLLQCLIDTNDLAAGSKVTLYHQDGMEDLQ